MAKMTDEEKRKEEERKKFLNGIRVPEAGGPVSPDDMIEEMTGKAPGDARDGR